MGTYFSILENVCVFVSLIHKSQSKKDNRKKLTHTKTDGDFSFIQNASITITTGIRISAECRGYSYSETSRSS